MLQIRRTLTVAMLLASVGNAQNLVTNGDFTGGNTGFSTTYTFVASGISQSPGTFGIRTNSQDYNPNYTLFYDHTTGKGEMMLVDGSPNANPVAWEETVSVKTNSQYVFSAWATASDPYNVPTLQFSVNGFAIGSEMTLSANAGQWQQFLAVWNSGLNTTAALAVADENPQGNTYGNDFALDDFSFSLMLPSLNVVLSPSGTVVVSWPSPSSGFVLQQNADLTTTNWTISKFTTNDNGTTKSIIISPAAGNLFFRLTNP